MADTCSTPGCTNKRDGWKFCRACAEASKQAGLLRGRAKFLAHRKAKNEAKKAKEVKEGKVATKTCPVCKATEIPLKRHYCDTCRDETKVQRKRDSQRRLRQKEKTGPVHYGFSKAAKSAPATVLTNEQQEAINKAAAQRDAISHATWVYRTIGLKVQAGKALASPVRHLSPEEIATLSQQYQPPQKNISPYPTAMCD